MKKEYVQNVENLVSGMTAWFNNSVPESGSDVTGYWLYVAKRLDDIASAIRAHLDGNQEVE